MANDATRDDCEPREPNRVTRSSWFDWEDAVRFQFQEARVIPDRRQASGRDTDRRMAERLELNAEAKLCPSMREAFEGRLVDISIFGCSMQIEAGLFRPGDVVWMKMDDLQHWRGAVRWVRDNTVGVEFHQPFYPAVLDHIVQSNCKVVCSKAA